MSTIRARLLISGRVQGVNFRYYTQQQASSLGLGGWVRNLWDGRVEALFEGDPQAVEEMVAWCRRGPSSARVEEVEVRWEEASGDFQRFTVRATSDPEAL